MESYTQEFSNYILDLPDREIAAMCEEQTIMCFALLACLKGLREQGCNGPVAEALGKLEKHLNRQAHKWEEL